MGAVLTLIGLYTSERSVWLLRIQVAMIYFGAGLNKILDPDWLSGQFFEHWTVNLEHDLYLRAAALLPPMALSKFLCWATIATELSLFVGFAWPRLWVFAIWLGILFHAAMTLFTGITFVLFLYVAPIAYFAFARWPRTTTEVIYDGDCGICAKTKRWFEALDFEGAFRWTTFQSGVGDRFGISREALANRLHVVVDGKQNRRRLPGLQADAALQPGHPPRHARRAAEPALGTGVGAEPRDRRHDRVLLPRCSTASARRRTTSWPGTGTASGPSRRASSSEPAPRPERSAGPSFRQVALGLPQAGRDPLEQPRRRCWRESPQGVCRRRSRRHRRAPSMRTSKTPRTTRAGTPDVSPDLDEMMRLDAIHHVVHGTSRRRATSSPPRTEALRPRAPAGRTPRRGAAPIRRPASREQLQAVVLGMAVDPGDDARRRSGLAGTHGGPGRVGPSLRADRAARSSPALRPARTFFPSERMSAWLRSSCGRRSSSAIVRPAAVEPVDDQDVRTAEVCDPRGRHLESEGRRHSEAEELVLHPSAEVHAHERTDLRLERCGLSE